MVLEKSGMSPDTARILSFWQILAVSGKKSIPQRYNGGGHLVSGGRVYCSAKSFTGSSRVSESFTLEILLFHRACHYSDRGDSLYQNYR
jgi:hypothetical protein